MVSSTILVEVLVESVVAAWLLVVVPVLGSVTPMIRLQLECPVLHRDERLVDYMQCLMKMKAVRHWMLMQS